jgi:hypothetical protein
MRAIRDLRSAYQNPAGSVAIGVWPQAGFPGIAYRLAKLSIPRFGALFLISTLFYLV